MKGKMADPMRRTRQQGSGRSPRPQRIAATRGARQLNALQGFRTIFGSARIHDAEIRRSGGISGSYLWALSEIAAQDGLTVNGLAERMALHQSTASNLVNGLCERGLVRRAREAADQRIVRLHIIAAGEQMLQRAPQPHSGLLVDAIRRLKDEQLETLCQALRLLVATMRPPASDSAGDTLLGE